MALGTLMRHIATDGVGTLMLHIATDGVGTLMLHIAADGAGDIDAAYCLSRQLIDREFCGQTNITAARCSLL